MHAAVDHVLQYARCYSELCGTVLADMESHRSAGVEVKEQRRTCVVCCPSGWLSDSDDGGMTLREIRSRKERVEP
jgi:hypothetical protein